MKNFWTVCVLVVLGLLSCGKKEDKDHPSLKCGSNHAEISFRVLGTDSNSKRFAILLNGSPAISYFSDEVQNTARKLDTQVSLRDDPYFKLVDELKSKGYQVLELKYNNPPKTCGNLGQMSGYYSACCGQGLDNIVKHNADLYELAVQRLGFNPSDPTHRLVGFGWSLGAIQLETMAFISGKRIDKIGLTGVLLGDSKQGCTNPANRGGMSWAFFANLADALTQTLEGCSNSSSLEYTDKYNFKNFPYRNVSQLGIFEGYAPEISELEFGKDFLGIPGNPAQAYHIIEVRTQSQPDVKPGQLSSNSNTTWKFYKGCGHEVLFCGRSDGALDDIVNFLTD